MNIADAVKHLLPNAVPGVEKDFLVMDNGDGPFIAEWNLSDPQPSEAELQSAWDAIKDIPIEKPVTLDEKVNLMQKAIDDLILGGI